MKRILAAIDHSDPSLRGAQFAAEIAGKFGAELVLLTVAQRPDVPDGPVEEYMRLEHIKDPVCVVLADAARAELHKLCDKLGGLCKRPVRYEVAVGNPVDKIVSVAERMAIDLIVVGHVGHGRLGSLFIGSVAKAVCDRAPCPLLVVP